MVVFRSLKALIEYPNRQARNLSFLTTAATSGYAYPPLFAPLSYPLFRLPTSSVSRRLFPLSKWIMPFQYGPLFLSCPPWKLSQSSTPLYLQGNVMVLKKVEALNYNLNLLRSTTRFPPKLLDQADSSSKDSSNGFVESFINLPNLISLSRLVSGPMLGW